MTKLLIPRFKESPKQTTPCIHGALTHGSRVTSAVLYFFSLAKKDMPRLKRGREEVITVPIRLCIGNINLSLFMIK